MRHRTTPDKDWVDSIYREFLKPIEIIDIFRNKTKDEMANLLREGISLPLCNYQRMILFRDGPCEQGILCEPSQIEQVKGGVRVKNEIYGLPCYNIKESDLLHTRWTSDTPKRCLYRFLQLPQDSEIGRASCR